MYYSRVSSKKGIFINILRDFRGKLANYTSIAVKYEV